jgi:hypothetical protein
VRTGQPHDRAFPHAEFTDRGMTLRDYFAAAALQGLLASAKVEDCSSLRLAWMAYEQADAMIIARDDDAVRIMDKLER